MDIKADTHKSQEKTSDVFDSYSSLYGRDKQQQQQQQQQNKNTFHTWHYPTNYSTCTL